MYECMYIYIYMYEIYEGIFYVYEIWDSQAFSLKN